MTNVGIVSDYGLENHGLSNWKTAYWNLFPPELVEHIIRLGEGVMADKGSVVVKTGQHTGRSPNDKFIVDHGTKEDQEIWWGKINQSISPEKFNNLRQKMLAYLQNRDLFIQDMQVGAHPDYNLQIRVVSEKAFASLFAHNLFLRISPEKLAHHKPQFTVLHCPDFVANPAEDGTRTGTFIIIDFSLHLILIGGTSYAGEIKKSIFSIMNYLLPRQGILSMHCSANVGEQGDVALFFGLSGTGKTTLSSDPERKLIGDDEHGWSDENVFNFEGGCYAKTINLKSELEPIIWDACHRFGTVLENVVIDPVTRFPNFDDGSLTENTRAAYPITYVQNRIVDGYAGIPENVFFLTADAFGVLPPLAKLTPEQAQYYFLSGYTSKLAGTEKGLGAEPEATFSTCFGAPFLPLPPSVYAKLLGEKVARHHVKIWLVNTGWTGGPFGVGKRMKLPLTRSMIRAALTHKLDHVSVHQDPIFGLWIPDSCPEVPVEVLDPQQTWQDKDAYVRQARDLVSRFEKNFTQFAPTVPPEVVSAGPHL